jgi:O-antigen/teichoic acid export membrane protein
MCRAYFRASLYSGLSISACLLGALPFLPWVIRWAFPADYHEPVWRLCTILVPGFALMSFAIANDTFYLVTNTLRVGIVISVLGTIANTVVVAYLAWRHPTVGVAWGLDFTMTLGLMHNAYAWHWYRRHRSRLRAAVGAGSPSASDQA